MRGFRVFLFLYSAAALSVALNFSALTGGTYRLRSRGGRNLGVKVLIHGRGVEQPLAVKLGELLEGGSFLGIAVQG
jgi:hypothetical protein